MSCSLASVRLRDDESLVAEFDAGGRSSHLVVDEGRVLGWRPGPARRADVRLRWTAADANRLAWGTLAGAAAMAATRVVDANGPGGSMSAPPMGLAARDRTHLPPMFGATMRVQLMLTDGPFGPFQYAFELVDGVPVRERFGAALADVVITLPYRTVALVFAGRISVLEAIADGEIAGELAALAALAGVLEGDELRAHMARLAPAALALTTLGELRASSKFEAAFARVMAGTALP